MFPSLSRPDEKMEVRHCACVVRHVLVRDPGMRDAAPAASSPRNTRSLPIPCLVLLTCLLTLTSASSWSPDSGSEGSAERILVLQVACEIVGWRDMMPFSGVPTAASKLKTAFRSVAVAQEITRTHFLSTHAHTTHVLVASGNKTFMVGA